MQTVIAADGTEIAYETHGDGPPIVLYHGTTADRHHWGPLVEHLAGSFTLVAADRRGRGDSGDADEYSLDREADDLRALVDAVRETADRDPVVFGHSFGGLVTLAAAPDLDVEAAVLYEPAVLVEDPPESLADAMAARLEDGDRRGALRLFVEEAGGNRDVEQLSWWPEEARFDRVETVVRENYAVESFDLPEEPAVDAPTLLLTGEHGPSHLKRTVAALDERLPDSRVVEFDGQGHSATTEAPERVAAAVREFLADVGVGVEP